MGLLEKFTDWILGLMSAIPAVFVPPESAHFYLFRALFALIFLALLVYLIAMQPFRPLRDGVARVLRRLLKGARN